MKCNSVNYVHEQYLLLSDKTLVATGTEATSMTIIHGHPVNKDTPGINTVNTVLEVDFIPKEGNPMEEPIQPGQFVLWDHTGTIQDEEEDTSHLNIRLDARINFLKAAKRWEARYQTQTNDFVKEFQIGQTVGFWIHKADRINTDSRLLPCKILDIKVTQGQKNDKLYSASGILNVWFKCYDYNTYFMCI